MRPNRRWKIPSLSLWRSRLRDKQSAAGCHALARRFAVQLNYSLREADWARLTLFNLDLEVCELRKALIYKGTWRAAKTPKAGVAGSIPAGRAIRCSEEIH